MPSDADAAAPGEMPDTVDVLIVGCGPAGLVLAAQLAAFPEITTRIVERKPGPLELGQADGVACRTVEMFDAFGLSDRLLREGYWVNETVFWGPAETDRSRIVRTGRIQDVEDDLSEFPHLIVNQARIYEFLLNKTRKSASRLVPDYGLEVVDLALRDGEHPVLVTLARTGADSGADLVRVRARYVVGCDGARSRVREATGQKLAGESASVVHLRYTGQGRATGLALFGALAECANAVLDQFGDDELAVIERFMAAMADSVHEHAAEFDRGTP